MRVEEGRSVDNDALSSLDFLIGRYESSWLPSSSPKPFEESHNDESLAAVVEPSFPPCFYQSLAAQVQEESKQVDDETQSSMTQANRENASEWVQNEYESRTMRSGNHTQQQSASYFLHDVTPADTLGGLELRYGVSATLIRRLNGMTSDRLTSHLVLKIPSSIPSDEMRTIPTHLKPTKEVSARTERMQIDRVFKARFGKDVSDLEIDYYLKAGEGSLGKAIKLCEEDMEWEKKNAKLLKWRSTKIVAGRPKKSFARSWLASLLQWKRCQTQDPPFIPVVQQKKKQGSQTVANNQTNTPPQEVVTLADLSPVEVESIENQYLNASPKSPLMKLDYLSHSENR